MDYNIRENPIKSAILKVQLRAERQPEEHQIFDYYVDYGVLDRLKTNENEIIVGRRETGKTHLLKTYIQKESVSTDRKTLLHYINCSTLESGSLNPQADPIGQAKIILNRLLSEIKNFLLLKATRLERPDEKCENQILNELTKFDNACSEYFKEDSSGDVNSIIKALEATLDSLSCNLLIIVLDEWVAFPQEFQPFVAERIKHIFFSSSRICFKIASIEYQMTLRTLHMGHLIGFERGADIFCRIDLDNYLVYDTNKEHVEEIFASILFNHIFIEMSEKEKHLSKNSQEKIDFIRKTLFTTKEVFIELVRAGEGIVRDFLQIFSLSYLNYFLVNKAEVKISITDIRKAAASYFQREKFNAIIGNEKLSDFLNAIISEVIGGRKARSFMVEQNLSRHPLLQALFDARMLHFIQRGWSHQDKAGERYDIFTIDYGTYVDRINTSSCPQIELFPETVENEEERVPFDEKRRIRRIVLEKDFLKRFEK